MTNGNLTALFEWGASFLGGNLTEYHATLDHENPIDEVRIAPSGDGVKITYIQELCTAPWQQTREGILFDREGRVVEEGHSSYYKDSQRAEILREMLVPLLKSLHQYRGRLLTGKTNLVEDSTFGPTLDAVVRNLETSK